MKPGGDICEHVRKAKEYADELATIGQQLAERDRVIYLLKGLPKEYEMLITAWRAQADLPGWDVVVRRLQETHDMFKRNKTSSFNGKVKEEEPEERSFYTRQQRGRGGSRGQSRRITCYECGQDGHTRRNCTRQRSCFQCGSNSHLRRNCPRNNQQNRGSRGNNSNRNSRPNSERNRAAMSHEEEEYMTAWMVAEQDSSSATFTSQIKNNGEWLIDSGATRHMTASKELFTSLKKLENPTTVKVANGENLKAIGIGEIELEAGGGLRSPARLTETLYVPGLAGNLVSVPKISKTGSKVTFLGDKCTITYPNKDKIMAEAYKRGSLYVLKTGSDRVSVTKTSEDDEVSDLERWHRRLGHLNLSDVKKALSKSEIQIKSEDKSPGPCTPCIEAKSTVLPFPQKSFSRASGPLELVHSDVCGPFSPISLGKSKYFVTFT